MASLKRRSDLHAGIANGSTETNCSRPMLCNFLFVQRHSISKGKAMGADTCVEFFEFYFEQWTQHLGSAIYLCRAWRNHGCHFSSLVGGDRFVFVSGKNSNKSDHWIVTCFW